jgi:hypothetical protein
VTECSYFDAAKKIVALGADHPISATGHHELKRGRKQYDQIKLRRMSPGTDLAVLPHFHGRLFKWIVP